MKIFWFKLLLVGLLVLILHLVAAWLADGKTDPYYLKIASPQQPSLVIGTSRAAQGIHTQLIDRLYDGKDWERPIYNFAFTALNSPYGPNYLKSIRAKITPSTQNGLFLVTVDPWALSTKGNPSDDLAKFREKDLFLGNLSCVSCKPNFEYLFKYYDYNWGHILTQKILEHETEVMYNGRLAISIPMDQSSVQERSQKKLESYTQDLARYAPSPIRLQYLKQTLAFLQDHGQVYLVRIPVSKAIFELENQLYPDFDQQLETLAKEIKVPYLNHSHLSNRYSYTDGNHLSPLSGYIYTQYLIQALSDHK